MDTNEQFHQQDGTPPPGLPANMAEEQHTEKSRHPGEKAAEANPPEVSLAQPAEPAALAMTPRPTLANQFASLSAEHTKKVFADLSEEIRDKAETFSCACKGAAESWDALTPYLSQMQSLLSQRGEKRQTVLREAELPTWTEWFETFKKDLRLRISLRAVQKKLAKLRDKSVGGKNGKAEGRGQAAKPNRAAATYQHGYQAAKSELQAQLKTAAEKESALAVHIADLEKENEKLQGIARQLQEQPGKGEAKAVSKLRPHADALKEFVGLAAEAFRIINGKYGERLMGNADGNRLVEIAKKAATMKAKVKVC